MKRRKSNNYTWRKRGHRRRYTTESVQDGKYTPAADALIHRNNLRKVRPHARNEPLDELKPERYQVPSIERTHALLRMREIKLEYYFQTQLHHHVAEWNCQWLFGKPDAAVSIRMFFYENKAFLVKYDKGLLARSAVFAGVKLAQRYFEIWYHHGTGVAWYPINMPIEVAEELTPPPPPVGVHMRKVKDFVIDKNSNEPRYKPPRGPLGELITKSYIKHHPDALVREFKKLMDEEEKD